MAASNNMYGATCLLFQRPSRLPLILSMGVREDTEATGVGRAASTRAASRVAWRTPLRAGRLLPESGRTYGSRRRGRDRPAEIPGEQGEVGTVDRAVGIEVPLP